MITEFRKLLQNENRPHIIFANIHRRQYEIDLLLETGTTIESLDDEHLLDDIMCRDFSMRVGGRVCGRDTDVSTEAIMRGIARENRRAYEEFGSTLGNRVIYGRLDESQRDEYREIVSESRENLSEHYRSKREALVEVTA